VVEGWHGQAWGKPLVRTREYVEIVRAALRREVVEHRGEHYRIPYDGPGATGLGKPLKLMLRPLRAEIPIYLAAIGPKNVALAAEIADGWLPIFVDPERFDAAFGESVSAARDGFEVAATVNVLVGDDVQALRDSLKPHIALYVGGMGAKGKNFYNSLVRRYGWEAEADRIQELYLGGRQRDAIAAVPDELVDALSLVGPKERIRDRLEAWRETPVTTLVVGSPQPEALEVLAELVL
jgi:F420-dependent oxidoreductase-like protein